MKHSGAALAIANLLNSLSTDKLKQSEDLANASTTDNDNPNDTEDTSEVEPGKRKADDALLDLDAQNEWLEAINDSVAERFKALQSTWQELKEAFVIPKTENIRPIVRTRVVREIVVAPDQAPLLTRQRLYHLGIETHCAVQVRVRDDNQRVLTAEGSNIYSSNSLRV